MTHRLIDYDASSINVRFVYSGTTPLPPKLLGLTLLVRPPSSTGVSTHRTAVTIGSESEAIAKSLENSRAMGWFERRRTRSSACRLVRSSPTILSVFGGPILLIRCQPQRPSSRPTADPHSSSPLLSFLFAICAGSYLLQAMEDLYQFIF